MSKNVPAKLTADVAARGMAAIQDAAERVQHELITAEGFGRTLAIATGLVALQDAMTDETLAVLKALEGKDVGFKTDKDQQSGGYDIYTIKDVAVRALLHGAYLHGNEFNIIAGGCYLTQQFYLRKLREYPGVTDVQIDIDIPVRQSPEKNDKNAVMLCSGYASCRVNGKLVEIFASKSEKFGDRRFAVSAFYGDIAQAQGKAKKRLAQKLYERIAGVELSDADETSGSVLVVEPQNIEQQEQQPEEPPAETDVDWGAELLSHGGKDSLVFEVGCLLRDAPTPADRADVMNAAQHHLADGGFDQRGFDTLRRYAEHKNAEEAVAV